ncbi:MAG: aldo/keto reductase [Acidimicrobiia bacterium]|nr:aldo/keto reductase [Acidimicrobiia bacterium]
MKYARFPALGRDVSRLGFGAMGFAGGFGESPDEEWIGALHTALRSGVNFIDTARAYGRSEEVVGRALADWDGEAPVVATKIEQVAGHNRPWATPIDADLCFPVGHIRRSAEASLAALGLDSVDLMQLHVWWPTWDLDGPWMRELQALKDEGLTAAVGVSIPDHRSDMAVGLVPTGLIDSVQTVINVFDPLALENLVPICAEHDVAVIGRCTLDEGGLTGFLTPELAFDADDYRSQYFDDIIPRSVYMAKVAALEQFVPRSAGSLAALAIKFVLHHPEVTTALVSMHERAYAEMNIAAVGEPAILDDDFESLFTSHRFIKNLNHAKHWDLP